MESRCRNCVVCSKEGAAYKCPRCEKPYCSIHCCTKHKKGTQCADDASTIGACSNDTRDFKEEVRDFATEDTVPIAKLRLLERSEELKSLLQKSSDLRRLLLAIDQSRDPSSLLKRAMKSDSNFQRVASICLKTVSSDDHNQDINPIQFAVALGLTGGSCSEISASDEAIVNLLALLDREPGSDDESSFFT